MGSLSRIIVLGALVVAPVRARAESNVDPSGHWEGSVQAPNQAVSIEVDLAKNARGQLFGTFGSPAQGERGLPLASVTVAGRAVTFAVGATTGGGVFRGVLGDDGRSLSGEFVLADNGATLAFKLSRTGDAKFPPPPRSRAIARRLEGSWTGTLAVEGKQLTLGLTMTNHADGTATGTLTSSGLELAVAMTQDASNLRIDVPQVSGSFTGVANAAGTELVGTWKQRSVTLPLTFRRAR